MTVSTVTVTALTLTVVAANSDGRSREPQAARPLVVEPPPGPMTGRKTPCFGLALQAFFYRALRKGHSYAGAA